MFSIEKYIENEEKRILEYVNLNRNKRIYIFGAGRMGKPLYQFLKRNQIRIEAFCVSDKRVNKEQELGIPIIHIDEIEDNKDDVIILFGVNPRLNEQVEKYILEKGFKEYLLSTEYLRYFDEYQYNFYKNPMLEITTKMGCEVNCKYCPQEVLLKAYFKTGKEDKYMSFETYKTCVDKLPKDVLIAFAGFTEPFFNAECLDMIQYAIEKGHKVNVFTTLRGLTKEKFKKMKELQFEEFVLHVPDNEGYSNIPITEDYLDLLDEIVSSKKPNGDNYIDYACSQGTVPEIIMEHLGNDTRVFVSLTDRAGNLDDENLFSKRNIRGKIRCAVSNTINHNILLPDGRVALCASDYGLKHVFGNLKDLRYEDIVNSDEAKRVIQCMNEECDNNILCRNCAIAYTVEGL